MTAAAVQYDGERVPAGLERVMQQCMSGKECGRECENYYLSEGTTTESEVADTEGSTATTAVVVQYDSGGGTI